MTRARLALAATVASWLVPAGATASTVLELDPARLLGGADLVVDGVVEQVSSRYTADRTAIETVIEFRVDRALEGQAPATVEILEPGGEVDGARQVVVGIPVLRPGEVARLFLRRLRHDPARYRIYGWDQGVWPAHTIGGITLYRPRGAAPPLDPVPPNGLVWQPDQIPVHYRINRAGSDDVPYDETLAPILAAFSSWQHVTCSSLSYIWMGDTTLGPAIDDVNVISFVESDWIYGEEAAAAASLSFAPGSPPTADVSFNGEFFTWAIGPEPSQVPAVQDIQSVLTHELGHFSGLTHSYSAIDTMYYAWRPWQSQRTLSAADKLGLCEIYPKYADECTDDGDCPDGESCDPYDYGTLCTTHPDPIGAPCNRERVECESFCLFTSTSLASGYCSRFCDEEPCPDGFHCDDASAGGDPVRVCFVGGPPGPDAGPGTGCTDLSDCPDGRYCGADGECLYDCVEDFDCDSADLVCNPHGQCVEGSGDDGGGGGCCDGGGGGAGPIALLLLVLLGWPGIRRAGARSH